MLKVLLKLFVVWSLRLTSAAPAKGYRDRSARQWILYDVPAPPPPPLISYDVPAPPPVSYDELQQPLVHPYNSAELDLQLDNLYHRIISYNQPLYYLPNVIPEYTTNRRIEDDISNIKNAKPASTVLKTKLNSAENLFQMFGSKLGIAKKPVKTQADMAQPSVSNFNTVSVLPEHLRQFLNELKEESLRRSTDSFNVLKQSNARRNAIIDHMNIDKYSDKYVDSVHRAQQMRSIDISLEENNSEEGDQETDAGIKALSDDQIRDLINFFDTITKIYDDAGNPNNNLTDTIEIIITTRQQNNQINASDFGKAGNIYLFNEPLSVNTLVTTTEQTAYTNTYQSKVSHHASKMSVATATEFPIKVDVIENDTIAPQRTTVSTYKHSGHELDSTHTKTIKNVNEDRTEIAAQHLGRTITKESEGQLKEPVTDHAVTSEYNGANYEFAEQRTEHINSSMSFQNGLSFNDEIGQTTTTDKDYEIGVMDTTLVYDIDHQSTNNVTFSSKNLNGTVSSHDETNDNAEIRGHQNVQELTTDLESLATQSSTASDYEDTTDGSLVEETIRTFDENFTSNSTDPSIPTVVL